ncbi:MAG: hypothetical protein K8S27_05740 [Candidatus Omnitrophica bacterium]|nr:hypothetical protein [Candidatus Omnitrophota bacterium]
MIKKIIFTYLFIVLCICTQVQAKNIVTVKQVLDNTHIELESGMIVQLEGIEVFETRDNDKARSQAKILGLDWKTIVHQGNKTVKFLNDLLAEADQISIVYKDQEREGQKNVNAYVYVTLTCTGSNLASIVFHGEHVFHTKPHTNEVLLNLTLIRMGLAVAAPQISEDEFGPLFLEMMEEAKANHRGVWEDPHQVQITKEPHLKNLPLKAKTGSVKTQPQKIPSEETHTFLHYEKQINNITAMLEREQRVVADHKYLIKTLKDKIRKKDKIIRNTEKDHNRLNNQVSSLQSQLNKKEKQLKIAHGSVRDELQKKTVQYQVQDNKKTQRIDSCKTEMAQLREEFHEKNEQILVLNQDKQILEDKIISIKNITVDIENQWQSKWKSDYEPLREELSDLKKIIKSQEKKLKKLNRSVKNQTTRIEKSDPPEIKKIKKELKKAEIQLEKSDKKKNGLKEQLAAALERQKESDNEKNGLKEQLAAALEKQKESDNGKNGLKKQLAAALEKQKESDNGKNGLKKQLAAALEKQKESDNGKNGLKKQLATALEKQKESDKKKNGLKEQLAAALERQKESDNGKNGLKKQLAAAHEKQKESDIQIKKILVEMNDMRNSRTKRIEEEKAMSEETGAEMTTQLEEKSGMMEIPVHRSLKDLKMDLAIKHQQLEDTRAIVKNQNETIKTLRGMLVTKIRKNRFRFKK